MKTHCSNKKSNTQCVFWLTSVDSFQAHALHLLRACSTTVKPKHSEKTTQPPIEKHNFLKKKQIPTITVLFWIVVLIVFATRTDVFVPHCRYCNCEPSQTGRIGALHCFSWASLHNSNGQRPNFPSCVRHLANAGLYCRAGMGGARMPRKECCIERIIHWRSPATQSHDPQSLLLAQDPSDAMSDCLLRCAERRPHSSCSFALPHAFAELEIV